MMTLPWKRWIVYIFSELPLELLCDFLTPCQLTGLSHACMFFTHAGSLCLFLKKKVENTPKPS